MIVLSLQENHLITFNSNSQVRKNILELIGSQEDGDRPPPPPRKGGSSPRRPPGGPPPGTGGAPPPPSNVAADPGDQLGTPLPERGGSPWPAGNKGRRRLPSHRAELPLSWTRPPTPPWSLPSPSSLFLPHILPGTPASDSHHRTASRSGLAPPGAQPVPVCGLPESLRFTHVALRVCLPRQTLHSHLEKH